MTIRTCPMRRIIRRYKIVVRQRIIAVVRIGTSKPQLGASQLWGNLRSVH